MAIALVIDNPEGSQEIYENVRAQLGLEGVRAGSSMRPGPSPNGGWRVLEVWESQENAMRFREERLMPAFDAAGVPRPSGRPAGDLAVARLHEGALKLAQPAERSTSSRPRLR